MATSNVLPLLYERIGSAVRTYREFDRSRRARRDGCDLFPNGRISRKRRYGFNRRALPMIVLNSEQPSDRLRFTLAHELGHLVMHRFPGPEMETEANDFASALLMPKNEITIALRGRRIDMATLAAFKPEWRVSMQAILSCAIVGTYRKATSHLALAKICNGSNEASGTTEP